MRFPFAVNRLIFASLLLKVAVLFLPRSLLGPGHECKVTATAAAKLNCNMLQERYKGRVDAIFFFKKVCYKSL